jgi:hypothetical protein
LYKVLTNTYFDSVIVSCIIISSVLLTLDTPTLDPDSTSKSIMYWIDFSTTAIFTIEAIIKIITFGFCFNGKFSYLKGMWNILDFIILFFSYIGFSSVSDKFRAAKMFMTFKLVRTMRILRSLRIIGRNEGLKVAVRALLFAIPNILNITIIMLLFHSLFGVISVSHFKGKMYFCNS